MARKYSSIWKELKLSNTCAIAASQPFHRRIIKAVIAEKYLDEGYKLKKANERKRTKICYKIDGARIRFFIREYDILTGISLQELGAPDEVNDVSEVNTTGDTDNEIR